MKLEVDTRNTHARLSHGVLEVVLGGLGCEADDVYRHYGARVIGFILINCAAIESPST